MADRESLVRNYMIRQKETQEIEKKLKDCMLNKTNISEIPTQR